MNLRDLHENIDSKQRQVGQLPADFQPPQTSPQLNGPYPGRNATQGYLVGEGEDNPQFYALVHKVTNTPLSTHRDEESARDAWRGLDRDQRPFYQVRSTRTPPRDWNMTEDSLAEFAPGGPDGGGGDDGFDKETLRRMAAEWNVWFDPRIKRALAAAGWEIGQDEGYDDEPGVFVVQSGDVNGHSVMSWSAPELRQLIDEATGDRQFDDMMRKIKRGTKKQATADRRERERQSREQARAAFGPSPADKLSIRPDKGISEMDSQGYRGHRGDEDPGKGPEKLVKPAKAKDVAKDAEKDLAKAMDREHAKKKQQDVAEAGYNPLDDERREQQAMDQERAQFKRDELEAELGGEEQRAQTIMSGTWYVIIDGQAWRRQGQPVTFRGRDAARRAGQTIKQRNPGKIVTITTQVPAVTEVTAPTAARAPQAQVTDIRGVTQAQWIQQHQSQGARIIQSKMVNGPVLANYPNGRQEIWRAARTKPGVTEAVGDFDFQVGDRIAYGWENEKLKTARIVKIADKQGLIRKQGDSRVLVQTPDGEYDTVDLDAGRRSFDAQTGKPRSSDAESRGLFRIFRIPDGDDRRDQTRPIPGIQVGSDLIPGDKFDNLDIWGRDPETAAAFAQQARERQRQDRQRPAGPTVLPNSPYGFQAQQDSSSSDESFDQVVSWYIQATPAQRQRLEALPMLRDNPDALAQLRQAAGVSQPPDDVTEAVKAFRAALAEGVTSEDILSSMKRRLGDYLQDVATAIRKDPDIIDKIPRTTQDLGPAVRTLKTHDGHEIRIHGNEDDGFRVSVRGRSLESQFASLEEAEIATEMYMTRRRESQVINDDYVEEKHIYEAPRDPSPGKITRSEDPCWQGYHMVGTKKKGGRTVPNCVPGTKGQ